MDPVDLTYAFDTLLEASVALGADLALVQGAGGNFSLKFENELWIKASGTRLSEAREKAIYLPLDIATLSTLALVTEDIAESRIDHQATAHLRPSIETALHVLLPHRFVFHVHSVSAISAGLTEQGVAAFKALSDEFRTVEVLYAKPGIRLANAVALALGGAVDPAVPLALLLRNHGIVVGAETAAEASRIIKLIETNLRASPTPASTGRPESVGSPYYSLYPAGTLTAVGARAVSGGALTPDSAVFLGGFPFADASGNLSESPGHVGADGSVSVLESIGDDELEILMSLVDVARQIATEPVTTLTRDEVADLVNWEAEKWRHQMKR